MAVKIVIGCEVNSQSIVNNTSNVTCWVSAVWTGGSYNLLEKSGYLIIDGTKYTFTSPFNTGRTTSGSVRMFTKTVNVTHNADGTKTLALYASYTSDVSSGTVAAGAQVLLDAITRASILAKPASTVELGKPITFTINRQGNSGIKETLYFSYATTLDNYTKVSFINGVGTNQTTQTYTWTPPLTLANEEPNATTMKGTVYHECKADGTTLSRKNYPVNLVIPDSLKPTIDSLEINDEEGHEEKYGALVKGISSLRFRAVGTISYKSGIKSGSMTAGNTAYPLGKIADDDDAFEAFYHNIIPTTAGEVTFTASVTDARGRTATKSVTKTVLDYKQPTVAKLTVLRCNFDGAENDQGEYIRVKFTSTATPLNNANSVGYTLRYKKSADAEYTTVDLGANALTDGQHNPANTSLDLITANPYEVTDAVYIFKAASDSSYDIELHVEDDFIDAKRATIASTAFTLMHWKADGTGMGIGKIAEESNLFDVGMAARFNEPVCGNVMGLNKLPEIPENSDLNDYMATGSYAVYKNAIAETIANIPVARAGRLEVSSSTGEGIRVTQWSYLRQKFIPYNSSNPTWERDITRSENNVWTYGEWYRSSLTPDASERTYDKSTMREWLDLDDWSRSNDGQKVLWGENLTSGMYMTQDHTATLTEGVSQQRNGIVLMFCYYNGTGDTNWGYQSFFIPKVMVELQNGKGHTFSLTNGKFGDVGTKYLYISDDKIVGHIDNTISGTATSGITYANNRFVLRYVFGV